MSQDELSLDEAYAEESTEVAEVITKTIETDEVKADEPETTEETVKTETEEKPEESTTDSKKESWTFSQAMDEREKRQKWETRAEKAEARLAELETKKDDVSIFDNEEAWKAEQDQKIGVAVEQAKMDMSRAYAVKEFGEEKVAAAEAWTETEGIKSPFVLDNINRSDLKYHKAIELMEDDSNRHDPEKFAASIESKVMEKLEADGWTRPDSKSKESEPITPSLASKRSAGGEKPVDEDFEDILN